MTLLRTAVLDDSDVVRLTVLCAPCANELLGRIHRERPDTRSWTKECIGPGSSCEFCVGEVIAEVM